MSQKECEVDGLFMIIAGSDTTASAIRITMLHIMACPQVYHKLKQEIATAVQDGKASYPISYEEARKLPYLQVKIAPRLLMADIGYADCIRRLLYTKDFASAHQPLVSIQNQSRQKAITSMESSFLAAPRSE